MSTFACRFRNRPVFFGFGKTCRVPLSNMRALQQNMKAQTMQPTPSDHCAPPPAAKPLASPKRRQLLACLAVAPWASACSTGPVANGTSTHPASQWPQALPNSAGFDASALAALLARVQTEPSPLHSLLIERAGKLVAEVYRTGPDQNISRWYGLQPFQGDTAFDAQTLHDVRSISKSVVSLLFGISMHRGQWANLDTPVMQFYPEHAAMQTPALAQLKIRHLLDMSSGWDWSEGYSFPDDETRLFWKQSISAYMFSRPQAAPPGQRWNYNGGCTALLAEILVRQHPGQTLQSLAQSMLLEPLGIQHWEWVNDIHGRALAFAGLRLRPRDLLKLGRLLLNQGQWSGQAVVPPEWVKACLQPAVATTLPNALIPTESLGYARQFWQGSLDWQSRRLAWTGGYGNGGQRLFVVPGLDLSVAISAGTYGDHRVGKQLLQTLENVVNTVRA